MCTLCMIEIAHQRTYIKSFWPGQYQGTNHGDFAKEHKRHIILRYKRLISCKNSKAQMGANKRNNPVIRVKIGL